MIMPQFARLALASSIALALAACGGNGGGSSAAPETPDATTAGDVFALTASNRLISFDRATPGTVRTSVAISGLQSGENLVGIDFRPADNLLYGVASTGRIYTITSAGVATLKSTLSADVSDTTAPYTALSGTNFGVDFNPMADRLRVVSNTGLNLRINVDTGAATTDGVINGGPASATVTAAAYTNSFAGTGSTVLYAIDTANDVLYVQNPPNNGTLSAPVALGLDASATGGIDIDARNNRGYAVFTVAGARNLYALNLAATSAPATLMGAVPVSEDIRAIALVQPAAPLVFGLTDSNTLASFRITTPNTLVANTGLSNLANGERLLGIDFRPRDGLLYGITSSAKIVTIDTATGAVTLKSTLAADATDTTLPYSGLAGSQFAVDFNPLADRLRVISDSGLNLRINVDTGATTTDGAINGAGTTPAVTAGAYTNSFAGTTATTLFDIDTASSTLYAQNPPNDGTLAAIGTLGMSVAGDVGLDIAGGANGLVLAALRPAPGAASSLYRVDLATGAATPVNGVAVPANSVIGNGLGVRDIAIQLK